MIPLLRITILEVLGKYRRGQRHCLMMRTNFGESVFGHWAIR